MASGRSRDLAEGRSRNRQAPEKAQTKKRKYSQDAGTRGTSGRKKSSGKRRHIRSTDFLDPRVAGSRVRKKRLRAKRRKLILRSAAAVFICAAVVFGISQLVMFLHVRKYDGDRIMDGVYIGSVSVGGMTEAEVKDLLEEELSSGQESTVEFEGPGGESLSFTLEELGLSLDAGKLAKEASDYGKTGSLFHRYRQIRKCEKDSYVIPRTYSIDEKEAAALLETQSEGFFEGPVNATIKRKGSKMTVKEGKEGQVLDTAATLDAVEELINGSWDGSSLTVSLLVKTADPEVKAADLETVQDLLGSFETYYGGAAAGSAQNIEVGAEHISGSVVMPGEEYSADAAMRPYTEEEGYTASGAYENGEVVQSMGGGICQVSTTLYNALLLAELEITERYPHSMLIDYVDPSMDAAIAGDIKDLKFRNNYDTPVYIECVTDEGYLTVNIYGKETRPENRTIEYVSETLASEESTEVKFVGTENYVGYYQVIGAPRNAVSAQAWKVVYEDGKEVSRDVVNTSYYASSPTTIGVGTATSDQSLKNRILSAISSQNEAAIKSVLNMQ